MKVKVILDKENKVIAAFSASMLENINPATSTREQAPKLVEVRPLDGGRVIETEINERFTTDLEFSKFISNHDITIDKSNLVKFIPKIQGRIPK